MISSASRLQGFKAVGFSVYRCLRRRLVLEDFSRGEKVRSV
jgi:hypothetical protein